MAVVVEKSYPRTIEQAAELDPDLCPGEIDEGTWVPMSKNSWRHGEVCLNLAMLLGAYCRTHKEWRAAINDPGAKLGRGPDILRGPDIAVIRRERRPLGDGSDGWVDGSPELVVEVIGSSQAPGELARKALQYLASGAKLVWVVDEKARLVVVYSPPNQVRVVGEHGDEDVLDGGDLLPGFSCCIAELFE